MRHGIALPLDDPNVGHEAVRPLSDKGVKRIRKAAKGLRQLDIRFDCILTSPLPRARQTAEIVASMIGKSDRLEEISGLAPESTVDHLLFGLTRYQDRDHLLLVGHEPLLGETASRLLGGRQDAGLRLSFKKGSLCRVEIAGLPPVGPAKLHWVLTPKQLRMLG